MKEESESLGKLDSRLGDYVVGAVLFDKFEILDVIADGGKGRVLKVRNIDLQSLFALKVLSNKTISDEDLVRFHNEAKLASKLSHPNIASVFDFGSFKGFPYLVMELVDGQSLKEYLNERRVLNHHEFLDVFVQVTKALVHAHQLGVIHRDVKPANIAVKVDDSGLTAKLLDFGLAKRIELDAEKIGRLTATGAVLGTPLYMSPEQARALPLSPKTDAYSLGCVMWEALVGQPPLVGDSAIETLLLHQHSEPASIKRHNAEIPSALAEIIDGLLKKDPDSRPDLKESVLPELELLCEKIHEGNSIKYVDPPLSESPAKKHSLNSVLISSVVFALTISVVFFVFLNRFGRPDVRNRVSTEYASKMPNLPPEPKPLPSTFRSRSEFLRLKERNLRFNRFNKAYENRDYAEVVKTGPILARDSDEIKKNPKAAAELLGKIGWGYEEQHRPRDAFKWYQKSLDSAYRAFDKGQQLSSINSLLRTGFGLKETKSVQRERWLSEGEALALELFGKNSAAYAHQLLFFGDLTAHDHPTAVRYYRRCLDCLRTAIPHPYAPSVNAVRGQCLISLGLSQAEFGDPDQAIKALQQALKSLVKEKNLELGLRIRALNADITLADLLMRSGRLEDSYRSTDFGIALSKADNVPKGYKTAVINRRRSAANLLQAERSSSK